jgi:hypothetical protein
MAILLAGVYMASGQGPGPDVNGFKVGGDFMLLNSIEYQLPVRARDDVHFVAFVDGGTVEDKGKSAPKSKLEEMLTQALQNNPDLRVAKAKQEQAKAALNEAEAEVNRALLQVAQKVTSLYQAVDNQKAIVGSVQDEWTYAKTAYEAGKISVAEFAQVRGKLEAAKAKQAELESELSLVLGKAPPGADAVRVKQADTTCLRCHQDSPQETWDEKTLLAAHHIIGFKTDWLIAKKTTKGPLADKIRAALDKEVRFNYSNADLDEVIKGLQKETGLTIQVVRSTGEQSGKMTFRLEGISFGAALQWLEDILPNSRVVIREYGLLITPKERVPPGAVLLNDFWKGAGKDKPKEDGDKKPGGN